MGSGASSCAVHPARPAESKLGSRGYCADCSAGIAAAARRTAPLVQPRECFVAPRGSSAWVALTGSPCVHWLAHELALAARPGGAACAAGFALAVAELLGARRELQRTLPRARDLWLDLDGETCGLVTEVRRGEGDDVSIGVRGLLASGGRLDTVDFYRDLHGRGRFFR